MARYANPPFDRPDATFILRSSDSVDFKIHREILSVASSVFEGMFQVPQPIQDPSEPTTANGTLPIVDIPEDSDTLDALFRLIYPTDRRRLTTPEDVGKVLVASIKYQLDSATSQMLALLKRFSRTYPVRTYAIACKLELEDVARLAADRIVELRWRGWSVFNGGDARCWEEMNAISSGECYLSELDQVSAGCYYRLLRFISAETSGNDRELMKLVSPSGEPSPGASSSPLPQFDIGPWGNLPPDLIIRSSDGVELRAHRQMVSMASPVLEKKIISCTNAGDIPLPVLELDEDYPMSAKLLQYCYPVANPDIGDLTSMKELLDAATKYRLNRVVEAARPRLLQLKEVSVLPLRGYFLAIQYGWYAEARIFATRDALCPPNLAQEYVPEMEAASARAHKNLLEYRKKCKHIISLVINFESTNRTEVGEDVERTSELSVFEEGALPALLNIAIQRVASPSRSANFSHKHLRVMEAIARAIGNQTLEIAGEETEE